MIAKKLLHCFLVTLSFLPMSLMSRDVILEFKGAYFHATGERFKKIYKGGALYGPELTMQLCDCSSWYGFASVDFLSKEGHSIGLNAPTKVKLMPLAFGIKYFMSCWECADFYVGLGFQPVRVHTKDFSPLIELTKWAFGGIAKIGTYIDLSNDFLLDLFIDYSFARVSSHTNQVPAGPVVPLKASINGVIFGAGLGYRF